MPRFDTENDPPINSCGLSAPSRAFFANAFTSAPIAVSDLTSAPVTMGVINPSSVATATHTSTPSNDFAAIVFASHPAFNAGTSRNARPTAYITQSFTLTFTP